MTTDELIEAYKTSKKAYDNALASAFEDGVYDPVKETVKPLTEEKAKLQARLTLANSDIEDPTVIIWRLRARLGLESES